MNEGEKMMESEDQKYENVINILNKLQKVKVPQNFETELMNKINSPAIAGGEKKQQSFWEKIFIPFTIKPGWISSRLIPSSALAIVTVIILFVINTNSSEGENPLLSEPRVREDVITQTSDLSEKRDKNVELEGNRTEDAIKDEAKNELTEKPSEIKKQEVLIDSNLKNFAGLNRSLPGWKPDNFKTEISSNINYIINKSGLNFRMVNLNEEEKNRLKEKIKSLMERYNKQR